MAVVTPTDRPKSVPNRCVIKVCGGVFVLSAGFMNFCSYRNLCERTESYLCLFFLISLEGIYSDKVPFEVLYFGGCPIFSPLGKHLLEQYYQ